jgi:putative transposase
MTEIKRTRHSVYNPSTGSGHRLNYHLVWIPKYRCSVLTGPVAARLQEALVEVADQYELEILALEGMPDHIHPPSTSSGRRSGRRFVSAPPRCSPAQLVNLFKGISSRRLRQEFPALRRYPNRKHLWTTSYYVGTAGPVEYDQQRRVINNALFHRAGTVSAETIRLYPSTSPSTGSGRYIQLTQPVVQ